LAISKSRNGGTWTEARFNSFVKSALRSASQRWPPKYTVLNEAFVEKKINPKSGRLAKFYRCNACQDSFVLKEIQVNHKTPVVPTSGFDDWNGVVDRMFCEREGLEALCIPCHKIITKTENEERRTNDSI
jgi:hypothetical protein